MAIILAALEDGPAHGYLVARRIETWSDGAWTLRKGSLYPVLHGIEAKGLLTVVLEQQGRRSQRVYSLTAVAHARLASERTRWRRQTKILQLVL